MYAITDMLGIAMGCVLAFLAVPPAVEAHGWLYEPLGRQWCNEHDNIIVGAGNGAHGRTNDQYGGVPGPCGDPFETDPVTEPASDFGSSPCGESVSMYAMGDVITVVVQIEVNHGGLMRVGLCPGRSTGLTQSCFTDNPLTSDDTDTIDYWIMTSPKTEQHEYGMLYQTYETKWRLPEDLACDPCVLQWRWWAANSCIPTACDAAECGLYAEGKNPMAFPDDDDVELGVCENMWPAAGEKPQMFHNCADVVIIDQSQATTTDGEDTELGFT